MIDSKEIAIAPQPYDEACRDQRLAELMDNYLCAMERGAALDVEQLVAENVDLEDDIRTFAKSLDSLHKALGHFCNESLSTVDSPQPTKLGDFEIRHEIGRGGMGVVYEAQQLSLDRKVALKVLPFAAMWDEKQVARFRNEALAAAQLHHPNIVPVYAVGLERGVHFYAMQFVAGHSLGEVISSLRRTQPDVAHKETRHLHDTSTLQTVPAGCAQHNISDLSQEFSNSHNEYCRSVARLGVQAAEALHYAHERGVVHRDVKPSNIMLDDHGKLWITDFGLARVENNPGVTVTGDIVGTLRYMSPEQAGGLHALVDQRTDVYALGATLYELLTLQPAFPGDERRKVLQSVEHDEPPTPRSLNSSIPLDLETIVMQAMAKSRDQRYETAQVLADDLNRFLQGRPTVARRVTVVDRGLKWLRRHRYVAAAATTILLIVASLSTVGAILLARKSAETEAALIAAENNLNQARLIVDRFGSYFSRELERLPGSQSLRRQLLQDTLSYYKEFIDTFDDNVQLQTESATTAYNAARIAVRLGEYNEARQLFEQALNSFVKVEATVGPADSFLLQRAACFNELGLLEASLDQIPLACQHLQSAIKLLEQHTSNSTAPTEMGSSYAEVLMNYGLLRHRVGDSSQAKVAINQAIDLLERETADGNEKNRNRHDVAIALNNLSFVEQGHDWPAARESCQAAISILKNLREVESNPQSQDFGHQQSLQSDLALSYNNLGAIESHLGQHQQAVELHKLAISLQEQLIRWNPAVVSHRNNLAVSWNNLGQALAQQTNTEASNHAFQQAQAILQQLTDDYPSETGYLSALAGVLNNQAMALEHAEDIQAALELYNQAIALQQDAVKRAPEVRAYRENLSKHYANCSRAMRTAGQPTQAVQMTLQRRQLWEGNGRKLFDVARDLASVAGDFEINSQTKMQRETLLKDVLDILQQAMTAAIEPKQAPNDVADFPALAEDATFRSFVKTSQ